jgi:hypothetical protein
MPGEPRGAARLSETSAPPALRVHVGRLVLQGAARADERRITASMAAHLAAFVEGAGLDWAAVTRLARVDGGTISSRATPDEIGRHLAHSIIRGLTHDA